MSDDHRKYWSKHRWEMEEELATDPIVQRTGKVSRAALKRASEAVHRRFECSGVRLAFEINLLLRKDKYGLSSTVSELENIENSLAEFTLEELKIVNAISKALAALSERAKQWSERLPQLEGDVVDGEASAAADLYLEHRRTGT
jgi:hypothetical protein